MAKYNKAKADGINYGINWDGRIKGYNNILTPRVILDPVTGKQMFDFVGISPRAIPQFPPNKLDAGRERQMTIGMSLDSLGGDNSIATGDGSPVRTNSNEPCVFYCTSELTDQQERVELSPGECVSCPELAGSYYVPNGGCGGDCDIIDSGWACCQCHDGQLNQSMFNVGLNNWIPGNIEVLRIIWYIGDGYYDIHQLDWEGNYFHTSDNGMSGYWTGPHGGDDVHDGINYSSQGVPNHFGCSGFGHDCGDWDCSNPGSNCQQFNPHNVLCTQNQMTCSGGEVCSNCCGTPESYGCQEAYFGYHTDGNKNPDFTCTNGSCDNDEDPYGWCDTDNLSCKGKCAITNGHGVGGMSVYRDYDDPPSGQDYTIAQCFCDKFCEDYGDCCADYEQECELVPPEFPCECYKTSTDMISSWRPQSILAHTEDTGYDCQASGEFQGKPSDNEACQTNCKEKCANGSVGHNKGSAWDLGTAGSYTNTPALSTVVENTYCSSANWSVNQGQGATYPADADQVANYEDIILPRCVPNVGGETDIVFDSECHNYSYNFLWLGYNDSDCRCTCDAACETLVRHYHNDQNPAAVGADPGDGPSISCKQPAWDPSNPSVGGVCNHDDEGACDASWFSNDCAGISDPDCGKYASWGITLPTSGNYVSAFNTFSVNNMHCFPEKYSDSSTGESGYNMATRITTLNSRSAQQSWGINFNDLGCKGQSDRTCENFTADIHCDGGASCWYTNGVQESPCVAQYGCNQAGACNRGKAFYNGTNTPLPNNPDCMAPDGCGSDCADTCCVFAEDLYGIGYDCDGNCIGGVDEVTCCQDSNTNGFCDFDTDPTGQGLEVLENQTFCGMCPDGWTEVTDESTGGEPTGCTDPMSCTFDIDATIDDGSCEYGTMYYKDSDGDGLPDADLNGSICGYECNGGQTICGGDPPEWSSPETGFTTTCIAGPLDCEEGFDGAVDDWNYCPDGCDEDCAGRCCGADPICHVASNPTGECWVDDACFNCNGGGIPEWACARDIPQGSGNFPVMDCAGECGGEAVLDDCGVCNGFNEDKDCADVCFGDAYEGSWYLDGDGDGIGCDETVGGSTFEGCSADVPEGYVEDCCEDSEANCSCPTDDADECGVCAGDGYIDACLGNDSCSSMDCLGVCGGGAKTDEDGVCCNLDGSDYMDDCGYCNGPSIDCMIMTTNPEADNNLTLQYSCRCLGCTYPWSPFYDPFAKYLWNPNLTHQVGCSGGEHVHDYGGFQSSYEELHGYCTDPAQWILCEPTEWWLEDGGEGLNYEALFGLNCWRDMFCKEQATDISHTRNINLWIDHSIEGESHFRMSVLRHDDDVPADIYNYQPGDINLDGSVNVLDVVGLVSQILGNYEEVEGDSIAMGANCVFTEISGCNHCDDPACVGADCIVNAPPEPAHCVGLTETTLWGQTFNIEAMTWLGSWNVPVQAGDTIDENICCFKNLEAIHLNNMGLVGEIPDCIGNLTKLKHLELDHNQLEGCVPESISWLQNLNLLHLQSNRLTHIPESICDLPLSHVPATNPTSDEGWEYYWSSSSLWCGSDCNDRSFLYSNYICPPYPSCLVEHERRPEEPGYPNDPCSPGGIIIEKDLGSCGGLMNWYPNSSEQYANLSDGSCDGYPTSCNYSMPAWETTSGAAHCVAFGGSIGGNADCWVPGHNCNRCYTPTPTSYYNYHPLNNTFPSCVGKSSADDNFCNNLAEEHIYDCLGSDDCIISPGTNYCGSQPQSEDTETYLWEEYSGWDSGIDQSGWNMFNQWDIDPSGFTGTYGGASGVRATCSNGTTVIVADPQVTAYDEYGMTGRVAKKDGSDEYNNLIWTSGVEACQRHTVGGGTWSGVFTGLQEMLADFNYDGNINILDVVGMVNWILGNNARTGGEIPERFNPKQTPKILNKDLESMLMYQLSRLTYDGHNLLISEFYNGNGVSTRSSQSRSTYRYIQAFSFELNAPTCIPQNVEIDKGEFTEDNGWNWSTTVAYTECCGQVLRISAEHLNEPKEYEVGDTNVDLFKIMHDNVRIQANPGFTDLVGNFIYQDTGTLKVLGFDVSDEGPGSYYYPCPPWENNNDIGRDYFKPGECQCVQEWEDSTGQCPIQPINGYPGWCPQ